MKLTLFVIVLGCPRASRGETAVLGTEAAGNWALQARAECCRPWVSRLFWTFPDPESFNYATLLDQIDTFIHFWFDERFEEKLKSTSCPGEHTLSLDPFISFQACPQQTGYGLGSHHHHCQGHSHSAASRIKRQWSEGLKL